MLIDLAGQIQCLISFHYVRFFGIARVTEFPGIFSKGCDAPQDRFKSIIEFCTLFPDFNKIMSFSERLVMPAQISLEGLFHKLLCMETMSAVRGGSAVRSCSAAFRSILDLANQALTSSIFIGSCGIEKSPFICDSRGQGSFQM